MIVVPAQRPNANVEGRTDARIETLVVDRQVLFQAALANLLEASPVRAHVVTTTRSDVALELTLAGGISLVFCELRAEPLTGLQLIEALAAQGCKVPVIMLGDEGDEPELAAALSTSVAGVFTKSSAAEEFLVGVGAVVGGHRAIGSGLLGRLLDRKGPADGVQSRGPASRLSPTELAILAMIGQAQSIPTIAATRGISRKTVRNHIAKIYQKLDLHGRSEAILWAARLGLTET